MPRSEIPVDEKLIAELAIKHCSNVEIAARVGIHVNTLTLRFSELLAKKRQEGSSCIKEKQYDLAMQGSIPMLIWLGKQICGQSERTTLELQKIPNELLVEEFKRRIDQMQKEKIDATPSERLLNSTEEPKK